MATKKYLEINPEGAGDDEALAALAAQSAATEGSDLRPTYPSASVDPAVLEAATQAAQAPQKPSYANSYAQQLQDIYKTISNRPNFNYDVNADPLYQQYKDQYIQGGKLAMRNTMGQAAALNGGYGSTYGQQVGQQAYDAYLQKLSDVIPELYGMAYSKYQDEGDSLLKRYSLLADLKADEYQKYRDALSDYRYEDEQAYSRQQQAYSVLFSMIKASGYQPTDDELDAAGMTRDAANRLRTEYLRSTGQLVTNPGGSSGGGGVGGSSGGGNTGGNTGGTGGNYTFRDIAGAYDNAMSAGDGKSANRLLAAAQSAGVISGDERKYIFKNHQTKDRI